MTEEHEGEAEAPYDRLVSQGVNWTVRRDFRELFEGENALAWEKLEKERGVREVKSGPHRTVYYVEHALKDGKGTAKLYVKTHHYPRWMDQLRNMMGRSRVRSEWEMLLAAKRRGVGCVEPVAVGERREGGTVIANYLVTEAAAGAVGLREFVVRGMRAFRVEAREEVLRQIARGLADFIREVHWAGIYQRDFHAGNILVRVEPGGFRFMLVDLHAARSGGPMGLGRCVENLVALNGDLRGKVSGRVRMRFLEEYARGHEFLSGHFKEYCRLIEARTEREHRRSLARQDRKCLGTNSQFKRARRGELWGHTVRERIEIAEEVLDLIPKKGLSQPDARLVKDGGATTVWEQRLDLVGLRRGIFLKRYNRRKAWSPLADVVRGSRAMRSWRMAHALANRGIAVARPLAAVERREAGMPVESWLVTEAVTDGVILSEWVASHLAGDESGRWRREAARAVGSWVRRLHETGFTNRDLKPNNILVRERGSVEFVIVDFDGVFHPGKVTKRERVRDMGRLAAGFAGQPGVRDADRMRALVSVLGPEGKSKAVRREWWRSIGERVEEKLAAWRKQSGC